MFFLNQTINSVVQVALFTLIPFICYLIIYKTAKGFLKWIGFFRVEKIPFKAMIIIFFWFLVTLVAPQVWLYSKGALNYSKHMVDAFQKQGWCFHTVATVAVWSTIQTSLSEEIFFRGFLGKRLSHVFGWKIGTSIQAAVFGVIHALAVWRYGVGFSAVLFFMAAGVGFSLGWLCIKKESESILYGWMVHALANTISPLIVFSFI